MKSIILRLAYILTSASAIWLAGCSTFGARQEFTYRKTGPFSTPGKVFTYSYNPDSKSGHPYFKDVYESYRKDPNMQKLVRNRMLFELMGICDDYYFKYTCELRTDIAGKNLLADSAALATSVASSAAGGVEAKTILSAISSITQGVSGSVDKNVLLNNTAQAIMLEMDSERSSIAAEILTKMKSGTDGYPLEAGLQDIVRYYNAGSLTAGVTALSKNAGKNSADNQKTQSDTAKTTSKAM